MKYKFLLLILFLFIVFPPNVHAVSIAINSFPSAVMSGDEFVVTFSGLDLDQSRTYYIKGLGGPSFTNVDTWNGSWLQQNSSWVSMPSFNSSNESSISGSIKARYDTSVGAGTQQFKLRIKDSASDPTFDSSVVNISVTTPQPTPTPTQNPTTAPTPTPTPLKSSTPVATKSPTPRPILTPTPTPEVLGESTQVNVQTTEPESTETEPPSPGTQSPSGPKKGIMTLGIIFVGLGLFAVGIAGYAAYVKSKGPNV